MDVLVEVPDPPTRSGAQIEATRDRVTTSTSRAGVDLATTRSSRRWCPRIAYWGRDRCSARRPTFWLMAKVGRSASWRVRVLLRNPASKRSCARSWVAEVGMTAKRQAHPLSTSAQRPHGSMSRRHGRFYRIAWRGAGRVSHAARTPLKLSAGPERRPRRRGLGFGAACRQHGGQTTRTLSHVCQPLALSSFDVKLSLEPPSRQSLDIEANLSKPESAAPASKWEALTGVRRIAHGAYLRCVKCRATADMGFPTSGSSTSRRKSAPTRLGDVHPHIVFHPRSGSEGTLLGTGKVPPCSSGDISCCPCLAMRS